MTLDTFSDLYGVWQGFYRIALRRRVTNHMHAKLLEMQAFQGSSGRCRPVIRRLTLDRTGLRKYDRGYAADVGATAQRIKRSQLYEWLRLKGYVAFNLPRLVSTLGATLLTGIAGIHVYVLISRPARPMYLVVYTASVVGCCLVTAMALWFARNPRVPQAAWLFGDLVSVVLLGVYLASRAVALPGLVAITGRWDFAPGTLAGALALVFVTVHMSVLLGINVAYPQRQHWSD